jgi:protein-S-isoprenylcysteine O-methyltransferase Ste14
MTLSFWLILLSVLVYGLVHSLLASLEIKAHLRQQLSPSINRWYRIAYNIIAVVTFAPILILIVIMPGEVIYTIPAPWLILTSLIQISAIIVLLIGLRQTGMASFLGMRELLSPEDRSQANLVIRGLYRYVRHPLYTAGLVFIWLSPYMTWNLLAVDLGLTIYIFFGAYFEERKLLVEYGEAYAEYRRRTPMLVPGLNFERLKGPGKP